MKWIKKGKIFDPTEHKLPNDCLQFAQSPQVLVQDSYVRIYFSTRALDRNKKYLSHIAFVDFTKDFKTILKISDSQVVPLGELGCFDEHGIFPINILKHDKFIYAYTCGWNRRISVSVDTAIGLAVSEDEGLTFKKVGHGPVLTASLNEPCLVGDGFVKVVNNKFHMWYIFGTGWKLFSNNSSADRTYKIGHATSDDGISWIKEDGVQIVADVLGEEESQALPTVIEIEGRFHMFFCYRQSDDFRKNKERGYKIGHAYSDDLIKWHRDDEMLKLEMGQPGAWDSEMQCYPHVFQCDNKIYILYNGNEFGRCGFGIAELQAE